MPAEVEEEGPCGPVEPVWMLMLEEGGGVWEAGERGHLSRGDVAPGTMHFCGTDRASPTRLGAEGAHVQTAGVGSRATGFQGDFLKREAPRLGPREQ